MTRRGNRNALALLLLGLGQLSVAPPACGKQTSPAHLSREQLIARYADRDSRFVDLDGVTVHYKDQGRGAALLLINGSAGDLGDWDGWIPTLAPRYRVIRVDLPGFGLSGPIASDNYSIDRMLALVDALMDSLGEEGFAIAGNSYGGAVAFRYAATRVDRVTALILINSAGLEWGMKRGSAASIRPNPSMTPSVVTRETIATGLSKVINDPAKITDALIQRRLDFATGDGRERQSALAVRQYEYGNPRRVLSHVRAPVLIEWGGASQALSVETADAFAAALNNARLVTKVVYPGGGHILNIERPEDTSRDAAAFLAHNVTLVARPPSNR